MGAFIVTEKKGGTRKRDFIVLGAFAVFCATIGGLIGWLKVWDDERTKEPT